MPDFLAKRLIEAATELSEPLAAGNADPAGGAIAAVVAALAASLAAAAAEGSSDRWGEAGGARAQAQALRRRALLLGERDVDAYAVARAALAERGEEGEHDGGHERDEAGDWRLGQAVRRAAEPPMELAACALDIAQLAQLIATHAAEDIRADAVIAATLAAASASAAAHLVEVNLVAGSDDQLSTRARGFASAAAAAAEAASSGA
jgi:formiminotetrahydrofolate cyclodeaminase